jgi:hypothetical protein
MALKPLPRIILAMSVVVSSSPLCLAQLPPTNMGKYVHQPGDNQYAPQAQSERHAPAVRANIPSQAANQSSGSAAPYRPVPKPPRPDYSIMPITCDEPIKPPGFPPLPDSLDLPALSMRTPGGGYGGSVGMPGSAGGYAGSGKSGGASGGPGQPTGVHQHYSHYDPSAFIPKEQQHSAGYKCLPAGPVGGGASKSDYYNANTQPAAPDPTQPQYNNNAEKQLKAMGKAPKYRGDGAAQQQAPEAVTVNQATTQDLSLPEDEQASGQQQKKKTNRFAQRLGQAATRPIFQMMNQSSGMTSQFGSMLRFK